MINRGEKLSETFKDIYSYEKTLNFMSEFSITTRELEVLLHILQGKSNKEIALSIGVSNRTIDKHIENIFKKLKVQNRTAAALLTNRHI